MAEPSTLPTSALGAVLDQLGALVLGHDVDDDRATVAVTGVVIDDRELGAPLTRGCAVLGVGAASDELVADLVARAGAAGAAAVFVKHRSATERPAAMGDPAVVEVAPDLAWEQLHVFVRTALLHVGEARPGRPQTLFDVANAIAVRVDGAVVIEDEHLRVVAYSSLDHPIDDARRATILGRQIPGEYVAKMREGGITTHLEGSADPVRFDLEGPGMLPRLVIALRSGGRTVGLLWTITDDAREADARRVLADTAPDVAVELLHHLTADASRATDRLAAARQLLDGRPVPGVRELLGAEPVGGYVALVLQASPGTPADPDPAERAAQFATVYVDAFHVPAVVAPVAGGRVEVVVGLTESTPADRARELLDELCRRTEATFGVELHGAMGTIASSPAGVPSSRRDALAVLDLLAPRSGHATAAYAEVRSEVALAELIRHADGAEHLGRGPIVDLLTSSTKADAALVATVRAYLASGGDVTRTAGGLSVHRNTVRYRVERFEEVTGIDLDDPTQRLVAEVQLRAAELRR